MIFSLSFFAKFIHKKEEQEYDKKESRLCSLFMCQRYIISLGYV